MRILDVVSAPGSSLFGGLKDGAGDDRFVYDEQAGWACVIDGATDVGPVRLFPEAESDAAWFAEAAARTCLEAPPAPAEALAPYFVRLVSELRHRCARASIIPLEVAPRASLPTAAVTWMRWARGNLEAATLGDTLALIETPDGKIGVIGDVARPEDESARARQVMQMSRDDRLKWLAELRARHNVEAGYWILGVQPEAVSHLVCQALECPKGSRGILMTDGFYRLVSPYGRLTHRELIRQAFEDGLGSLMAELRRLEASPDEDATIGRFKTSDDTTALMIEF